jgi:fructose-bisphosphate aldolase class II
MTKVNIGTALNIAMTGAVRKVLDHDAELVDARKYLAPGRSAMTAVIERLLEVLR